MRLKVRHETTFDYDQPTLSAIQILRLTPRNHDGQFVKSWRVEVDADYRLYRDEDPYGNITHIFSLDGPITTLRVVVEGEVETRNTHGIISGTAERLPVGLWLRNSRHTQPDLAIRMFAKRLAAGEGGAILPFLHALNDAVHSRIERDDAATTRTAEESFAAKSGNVQDLAQIYIAACHAVKIPARYIAGYSLDADSMSNRPHAWAEAYVDRIGWIGFDPSASMCTTDHYVRVACGPDAIDTAPIRGATVGGHEESCNVQVQVTAGRALIEE